MFTLIAMVTTVLLFALVLMLYGPMDFVMALKASIIFSALPLFLVPPLAWLGLSIARILTITIDRVDALVSIDMLTGLQNRVAFFNSIAENMRPEGVIMMIDADHFKSINDRFGHDAGDKALRHLAETIAQQLEGKAVLGRLGGEEFAAYVPNLTRLEGSALADVVCDHVRTNSKRVARCDMNLTVSIGVADHSSSARIEETMRRADQALYLAKQSGRNRAQLANDIATPATRNGHPPQTAQQHAVVHQGTAFGTPPAG